MLSVIVPAHNEAAWIGRCLDALLASRTDHPVEVIVVANGCQDSTAAIARGYEAKAAARSWPLSVLDLKDGGKLAALNAGEAAARFDMRAYLDADVTVSPDLIDQLCQALDRPDAAYASGQVRIAPCRTWFSRAYARIYAQVPFMTHGVPGCGLFAINAAGRARWGKFSDIISDDTYVRLQFAPAERIGVAASYQWPIVEGAHNLLKVRRRQDAGVAEIAGLYPELLRNDDKPVFGARRALGLCLRDPVGFCAYATIGLLARLTRSQAAGRWSRGR